MWLQLSQILKKIHRRKREKKVEKHAWDTRGYSFKHTLI